MQFDVVTLFPGMFRALTDWGITSRAAKQITVDWEADY